MGVETCGKQPSTLWAARICCCLHTTATARLDHPVASPGAKGDGLTTNVFLDHSVHRICHARSTGRRSQISRARAPMDCIRVFRQPRMMAGLTTMAMERDYR